MADVLSLFGLTPEGLSQQRYQQDLRQGAELAQLDPGAAARATLQSGVGQLGRGIAGMMGVEDPQMKLISARQQIIGQLDQTDPTSLLRGAKSLSDMGDQQGAFALADYARKAQSEIAQAQQRMRERAAVDPFQQLLRTGKYTPESLAEFEKTGKPADLVLYEKPEKPEKDLRFGVDRESIAGEMYDNKSFAQLTPTEKAAVNKRVEEEQGKRAEKGAAKLTNVMPGSEKLADIPKFRADVQKTIAPQIESVNAADQALQAINDSITKNNFISFNAARVQLAKALGDSQLSRRDVEQAGGDPSLFGKLLDSTSTLFTGTPTLETQNLIKNTLQAVKKVSTNKATREIDAQRQIAYSTPGYDKARVDLALKFPEFEATKQVDVSGDLAAQARALLKQRQEGKK
jgi:hypothetical protein